MQIVAPEQAGFSAERLCRIDHAMQGYVDREQLAGIVTWIARHGKTIHLCSYGQMDREAARPMTDDTIFRIFSMTKPVVSVALMMLYEEGAVQLQDPVATYIPSFADIKVFVRAGLTELELQDPVRPMTVRDLLTHTSGLTYGSFDDTPVEALYRKQGILNRDVSLAEMMERVSQIPLTAQPGSRWRYSISTDVVGRLVEVISGQSLAEFCRTRIFEPLCMADTGFHAPAEKHDRLAVVYGPKAGGGLEIAEEVTERFKEAPARYSGGGGLVSTVHDYARFAGMLRNRGRGGNAQILGRKTLALMTSNHLHPDLLPYQNGSNVMHGYGFGLGFSVLMDPGMAQQPGGIGTFSWSGAASTTFWVDPVEDLACIFLSQFMPFDPYGAMRVFRTLVYQALID